MLVKSGRLKRLLLHRNSVLVIAVVPGMLSGFSAVTAMNLHGECAAVPSAVLSIMVILFLFYKSFKFSNLTKSK